MVWCKTHFDIVDHLDVDHKCEKRTGPAINCVLTFSAYVLSVVLIIINCTGLQDYLVNVLSILTKYII